MATASRRRSGGGAYRRCPPARRRLLRGGDASGAALVAAQLDRTGNAFAQRARETGDAAYYARPRPHTAERCTCRPRIFPRRSGSARLALSRHDFRAGLTLGRRALALSPSTAAGYGVVGDALVELGRYEEAFETFNRMVSLKPSVSSYARVSYALRAAGRLRRRGAGDAASQWMRRSASRTRSPGRTRSSASSTGLTAVSPRLRASIAPRCAFGRAMSMHSTRLRWSRPPAATRLARSLWRGERRSRDAAAAVRDDARRSPRLAAAVRARRARSTACSARTASGSTSRRRCSTSTTASGCSAALALARAARADRPSIDGDDVLAWALARNGHCGEALRFSKRALRLGTLDAPKFFHRGMIERCLGHRAEATRWFRRALDLNPHFSLLWAPVARRYAS